MVDGDIINLRRTSRNTFLKSRKVITEDLCFMRALLIICAIIEVCSSAPDAFGVKTF